MKTIIVATDFSTSAMNAACYAADMALAIQAEILLLHVYQIPLLNPEITLTVTEDEMMKDAVKAMSLVKEELMIRTDGNVPVNTEFSAGIFFQELEKVCEKIKPYTVIMGNKGRTDAEYVLYGGHAVFAMKHLMWPLITVPSNASYSQIKKICLACDFDDVIEYTPFAEIIRLVKDLHAELHVINSSKNKSPGQEMIFESGMLQEMLVSVNPQYHFIVAENAEESIIEFVEKNNIDLLITLPKRRELLKQLIHKSFSKKVILQSHVPVLVLHSSI